jgi:hypothetical protein
VSAGTGAVNFYVTGDLVVDRQGNVIVREGGPVFIRLFFQFRKEIEALLPTESGAAAEKKKKK